MLALLALLAQVVDHTHANEIAESFQGPDVTVPTWLFWYLLGAATPVAYYFMSKR